jgi:hypothetical protein
MGHTPYVQPAQVTFSPTFSSLPSQDHNLSKHTYNIPAACTILFTKHLHIQTMVLPDEDDSDSQSEEINDISISSASAGSEHLPKPSAKNADKEMRDKMIRKEEKNVRNARFIVIVAGVACAAAVGAAVNIFARQNDQATFELEVRKSGRLQITHAYLCHGKTSLTQFLIVLPT